MIFLHRFIAQKIHNKLSNISSSLLLSTVPFMSRGISVSIVTEYGLDDRDSIPDRGRGFFQTGSGAHPASCPMGTGVLSPGLKRGRGVMLTTHPHLVPRLSMSRSYTSSPPHVPPWCVAGQLYFTFTVLFTHILC
jgi:hypothetical protein